MARLAPQAPPQPGGGGGSRWASPGTPHGVRLASALLLCAAATTAAAAAADTTCGGALLNPVGPGGPASAAGWAPTSKFGMMPRSQLRFDPHNSHNGSSGSLRISGGAGAWTTNLSTVGLAGKLLRLSFWRRTASPSDSATVVATLSGVATDAAGVPGSVAVSRRVSAANAGWQQMLLGDFIMPADAKEPVSLAVDFSVPRDEANLSWSSASLNVASFSCDVLEPAAMKVQSLLTKVGQDTAGKCTAYHGHASARIYSDDVPTAAAASTAAAAVRVFAGQSERVAFQIVVLSGPCAASAASTGWKWEAFSPVVASTSTLAIPATAMTVREVADIELTIGTPPHGRLGTTPEYLISTASPTAAAAAIPGAESDWNQSPPTSRKVFWFKLTVPTTASPGNFTSTVHLHLGGDGGHAAGTAGEATGLQFELALEIAPAAVAIPTQPSIDIYGNIWQHSGPSPKPDEATLKAYYGNLWDHRVFTGPDMNKLIIKLNADDSVNVSSASYEQELAYIIANSPFKGDTIGSKGGQWLKIGGMHLPGHHGVALNATWPEQSDGIQIFTDATNTKLTPRFIKASTSYLSQAFAILKRHGVGDRGLIKVFDEPTMVPATVHALLALNTHIKAVAKACGCVVRLRVSGGVPTPELVSAYSPGVWDMHSDAYEWYKPLYPAARSHGIQITTYNNGANLLSQPLLRTRTLFWALFKEGLSGALCWWSVSDWKRSGADFGGMFAPNMGFNKSLLYGQSGVLLLPSKPGSASSIEPLDTLQWEQTLLGLQDYELLHALNTTMAAARDAIIGAPAVAVAGLLPAVVEGEAALTTGVSTVTQGLSAVRPTNDITYTLDVVALEKARRRIQDAIIRLQVLLPRQEGTFPPHLTGSAPAVEALLEGVTGSTAPQQPQERRLIALIQAVPSISWVAANPANVSRLPFDGIVMEADAPNSREPNRFQPPDNTADFSFATMSNSPLNASALGEQLNQLQGLDLGPAKSNFLLVHANAAGPYSGFANGGVVSANFRKLAAAAAAAGVTGIFFDSECYNRDPITKMPLCWQPHMVCPKSCPKACLPTPPHYAGTCLPCTYFQWGWSAPLRLLPVVYLLLRDCRPWVWRRLRDSVPCGGAPGRRGSHDCDSLRLAASASALRVWPVALD